MNGEEALAYLRRSGDHAHAVRPEDVLRSYDLHASAYVTKPVDLARFTDVVRSIDELYFTTVRLPS